MVGRTVFIKRGHRGDGPTYELPNGEMIDKEDVMETGHTILEALVTANPSLTLKEIKKMPMQEIAELIKKTRKKTERIKLR